MPTAALPAIAAAPVRMIAPGALRLSELIAALSVALDITEGQPAGHAMRSCMIGMRLARQIGLPTADRAALFYGLLLKDLGCSSNAAKMCYLFGADDRQVKHDVKTVNWAKLTDRLKFAARQVAPQGSTLEKAMRLVMMAREGEAGAKKLIATRCERGAEIARMLKFPEATAQAILALDEHWNGCGHPLNLKGEQIPMLGRIMGLAQTVEVFFSQHGLVDACTMARERRGKWFDPQLVDALLAMQSDTAFWSKLTSEQLRDELAAFEPEDTVQMVDEAGIDRVAEAFAQVVDAKSPWTFKHSTGVAEIALGIASVLDCSADNKRDIRRAALLHDVGKLGVSNLILDKPGKPTDDEFAEIRRHPRYSYEILSRVRSFQRLAEVAGAHHEKLNGRGYHRGVDELQIPREAQIIAVADICEALSAKRPYREEMPWEKVMSIMDRESGIAINAEIYAALKTWQERHQVVSRAEEQIGAIERLVAAL